MTMQYDCFNRARLLFNPSLSKCQTFVSFNSFIQNNCSLLINKKPERASEFESLNRNHLSRVYLCLHLLDQNAYKTKQNKTNICCNKTKWKMIEFPFNTKLFLDSILFTRPENSFPALTLYPASFYSSCLGVFKANSNK